MNQKIEFIKTKYRYTFILLRQLVISDFKVRYQNSVLGYLWSLLRPMALFLILYVVFVRFLKVGLGVPNFPIYLLLGIVLWNFFVEVTTGNVAAIVSKGDVMRKINFPKYTIVVAGSLSAMINLTINLFVVGVFMVFRGTNISSDAVLVPLMIAQLYLLGLGIAFILSALFVRFRDVGYIWEVFVQGAFYATPILYPLDLPVPLQAQKILLLNPVAQIMQDMRHALVTDHTRSFMAVFGSNTYRIIPIALTLLIIIIGGLYFKKVSKYFAEDV